MAGTTSVPDDPVGRSEIDALLKTRRELGADYDSALVDSFAERVEAAIASRVSAAGESSKEMAQREEAAARRRWILGIVSVSVGVPSTALAAVFTGLIGVIVVWAGLALINFAVAVEPGRR